MEKRTYQPLNVLNVMRGFQHRDLPHAVTPYRFETPTGERHRIIEIRQVHRERVGKVFHYHYVVKTEDQRYFHLVFDSGILAWKLVQEVDEELFFS
ncbi:MAG: hypothetical protein EA360_05090 [Balneolaceae bacterium]|nr:MAG: hypothetical protein EA360_05090 [Balneolaceae bacterium]